MSARVSRLLRPALAPLRGPAAAPGPRAPTCTSQRLLAECGLVRQTSAGCLALLPLAVRALHKLEGRVARALEGAGAQRVWLPALAPRALWERSGRLPLMRHELFQLSDRHRRPYVLSPTHEETVTELMAGLSPLSHRRLPLTLYQISHKYRDEQRPQHGLLRAREFLMADAYSFHASAACALHTYGRVAAALARLFDDLRVPYHRVSADGGDTGGSSSHEWLYPAAAGEDTLLVCAACGHAAHAAAPAASPASAASAAAPASCERCRAARLERVPAIEVAHTFVLGERYSGALGATVAPAEGGAPRPLAMACYGVGVTRLLAAGVEALSGPERLRWPARLAPYTCLLIGPKEGSREWGAGGEGGAEARRLARRLEALPGLRGDVLWDDRHHLTLGRRLLDADRMGYPLVVVLGRAGPELHAAGAGAAAPAAPLRPAGEGELLAATARLARAHADAPGDAEGAWEAREAREAREEGERVGAE